jgi:hypothetical protein
MLWIIRDSHLSVILNYPFTPLPNITPDNGLYTVNEI